MDADLLSSYLLSQTIEVVEEEVERMLAQDSRAEKVTYGSSLSHLLHPFFRMLCFVISRSHSLWYSSDIIEDADPDASDSEFLTPRGTPKKLPQQHGSQFGSQFGDDSEMGDGEVFEGGATPRNGNDDGDDNLAAELARYVQSCLLPVASADLLLYASDCRGLKELEDSDEDEGKGDDEDDEDDDDDDEVSRPTLLATMQPSPVRTVF